MSVGTSRGVDAWGMATLVRSMRGRLIHQVLAPEVTADDFIPWLGMKGDFDMTWVGTSVRILGPGEGDASYDPYRMTIFVSAERRVTDVAVG